MSLSRTGSWLLQCLMALFGMALATMLASHRAVAAAETSLVEASAPAARGLPDLARGQRAAAQDRLIDAEADLRPLAERGYVEAQIALGKLYARIGTPDRIDAAVAWLRNAYRRAPQPVEIALGRLLARSSASADLLESQRLLASAYARSGDKEALVGLIRLYTDHPELDRDHRVAMLVERAEKIRLPDTLGSAVAWYRATPKVEGHPQHLVALCGKALELVPECHLDLVRAARRAGDHQRLQKLVDGSLAAYDRQQLTPLALSTLARLLLDAPDDNGNDPLPNLEAVDIRVSDVEEDEGEQPLRTALAQRVDVPQGCSGPQLPPALPGQAPPAPTSAKAGDSDKAEPELATRVLEKLLQGQGLAPVLAAGVIARQPDLLPNVDIEAKLKAGDQAGIAEARLYLGTLYLRGNRALRDPRRTLEYLQKAAADPLTSLQAHFFLGRLYQYGYLDESSPLLATQHLVYAARHGYPPADAALARLFTSGKGLCPNLLNAYVFVHLAVASGSAELSPLLEQVTTKLGPDQLAIAEKRLAEERAARSVAGRSLVRQALSPRVPSGDAS